MQLFEQQSPLALQLFPLGWQQVGLGAASAAQVGAPQPIAASATTPIIIKMPTALMVKPLTWIDPLPCDKDHAGSGEENHEPGPMRSSGKGLVARVVGA
jgi:hypothetical protein